MFYQLRYIFLFFFLELALISQAFGFQESSRGNDLTLRAFSQNALLFHVLDADVRDFGDVYEASETNENCQEDEHENSNLGSLYLDRNFYVFAPEKHLNPEEFYLASRSKLPLFLLFHSWKLPC